MSTTITFNRCGLKVTGTVDQVIAADRNHKQTCRVCFPENQENSDG